MLHLTPIQAAGCAISLVGLSQYALSQTVLRRPLRLGKVQLALTISLFLSPLVGTALSMALLILSLVLTLQSLRTTLTQSKLSESQSIEFAQEVIRQMKTEEIREEVVSELLHDVRTPLTGIQGCAQALISEPEMSEEDRNELLKIIEEESKVLAGLIGSLANIRTMTEKKLFKNEEHETTGS